MALPASRADGAYTDLPRMLKMKSMQFLTAFGGACAVMWVLSETVWLDYPEGCWPERAVEPLPSDVLNLPELPDLPDLPDQPDSEQQIEEFR